MYNFDDIVSGALDIAQSTAADRRNLALEPVHLLYGLLNNPASYSAKALKSYVKEIDKLLNQLPTADKSTFKLDALKPSTEFSSWITHASSRAIQSGRKELSEADLLFYLKKFLPQIEIKAEDLQGENENAEKMPSFLTNLNELAMQGKLDPVVGREREIRAVMEILGRRRKNNPVLVGEAGVGKTAVVEGLADLIVKAKVPDALKDKVILSLDLGALMAGTKFRGEFEERLTKLVKYIKEQQGQSLLFIDEIHQLVGAGKTEGAMDAANLLKPALARGELHCIGATTHDEYRKYILSDAALERRFRAVPITEPSEEDAIQIMMGLKDKFEIHHGIEISDDAIFSSVFLSKQYLPDKNLPDKAIDLIDEAAAGLKLSAEAMPPHLVELEAEIRSKMLYLKTEKGNRELEEQIQMLQKEFDVEKAAWEKEVHAIKRVSEVKNYVDKAKFDLEKAVQDGRYEEASRLKFSIIPELEKELQDNNVNWKLSKKDVAQVISRQTGIPLEKILRTTQENVLNIEKSLRNRVFGQEQALHEIGETLIAAYAGLNDPNRPLGSFLLLGPTGVGKTETARALAQFLFDSEDNVIRLDMSEYSEKHSCAKLIGAPAGYVGYEEGGILTNAVRKKPYSIVLFDEVEKAHPDFADILLQILDDGRLSDNKGRTASFKNTIILMTSNSKDIHKDFKPELLGRVDGILHYKALDESIMHQLVEKQLGLLNDRLKSKDLQVKLAPKAIDELARRGYDPQFGARPLRTIFSRLVVRPLSHQILSGDLPEGAIIGEFNPKGEIEFQPVES